MRTIVIEDYDPQWAQDFLALKKVYERKLSPISCQIIHVGSTSVKGLAAKPIIDVDIVVKSQKDVLKCIEYLKELGYVHRGQNGIKGRESFERKDDQVPYDDSVKSWRDHHLYCCVEGVDALNNHLKLKAFLQKHPDAVKEYSQLKKQLSKKHPHDIDSYVAEKTAFICGILKKSGMDPQTLQDIAEQNR